VREIEPDMVPMRCTPESEGHLAEGLLYEFKLDGVRAIVRKNGEDVVIMNRRMRDVTRVYPEVAAAVRSLAPARLVLDGEIIALDEAGQPSFQRLAQRIHLVRPGDVRRAAELVPVSFVVFDLLGLDGRDLRPLPLRARKDLLRRVCPGP